MQTNRASSNVERRKLDLITPQRSDIKDSGCPEQDADIIIALFNPHREQLKKHRGYNISILERNFREISVLKSRYGDGDISIGCMYFGDSNNWFELPKAENIYDYEALKDINYYLKNSKDEVEKIDEKKEKEDVNKQEFNIIL